MPPIDPRPQQIADYLVAQFGSIVAGDDYFYTPGKVVVVDQPRQLHFDVARDRPPAPTYTVLYLVFFGDNHTDTLRTTKALDKDLELGVFACRWADADERQVGPQGEENEFLAQA